MVIPEMDKDYFYTKLLLTRLQKTGKFALFNRIRRVYLIMLSKSLYNSVMDVLNLDSMINDCIQKMFLTETVCQQKLFLRIFYNLLLLLLVIYFSIIIKYYSIPTQFNLNYFLSKTSHVCYKYYIINKCHQLIKRNTKKKKRFKHFY